MTKPYAVTRAFDQTWYVRKDNACIINLCHAEIRLESRERIRGDFGLGVGQNREQRGLAGIRDADNSNIRDQLEFQFEMLFFGRRAAFGGARRLVARGGKVLIAPSAPAAFANDQSLARLS